MTERARRERVRQITVLDVACPKCGAAVGQPCEPKQVGGGSHRRRFYLARYVRRMLGLPQKRVLQNEYGQFRAAKR